MVAVRRWTRAAVVVLLGAGPAVWYACAERATDSPTSSSAPPPPPSLPNAHLLPDLRGALAAQRHHTDALLRIPGVVGTAVTILPDGRPGVQLLVERSGIPGLPLVLDSVPVTTRVTGLLMAFTDPTTRQRPAPLGYSVGHPLITAGTIGARVRDALGRVYILSNNHVLANSNGAIIGDPEYQPGPFDGGGPADQIATLTDFQTITFTTNANNTIDAAIALSSTTDLDNATPADEGYGLPNATIFGDADGDGFFDDRNALLGLNVQKYGRTTHLTHGQITGVNATVQICYEAAGLTCIKQARYVDQLVIAPSGFSGGGDSGSLIVTDDANLNPVALLFAGSSTTTIGNRIDLVLNRFGVTIDGAAPPPPGPFTDVAVTNVAVPGTVVQHAPVSVSVTVRNFGNQNVPGPFDVILEDTTEHVTIGTQSVSAFAAGAASTLTFTWTPNAAGDHGLVAHHTLTDDRAANDRSGATTIVNPPRTDVAVTGLLLPGSGSVTVDHVVNVGVTVGNVGNQDVTSGFVVTLRDSTAGTTIGTQSVAALAVGASANVIFSWNLANAALGDHTLIATADLADDDPGNNEQSATVTVHPKPTDIALTAMTGPSAVAQGDTAHIGVTVQNTGEVDVTSPFNVVLTDATAGGTIGTKAVPGLAIGASATVDIPWNTAGAAISGHILIATQLLPDNNTTNDSRAIGINVNPPPPPPTTDVAVTSVTAPGSVVQGTPATVGVAVQNVGGQNVTTSFTVTLTDQTAGVTIGTQSVASLAVGATATLSFSWNTAGAALGGHTLVATHSLTDANAANNQASATVTLTSPPVDLALSALSGPASVTQGDTAHILATVQNVGGQAVTASFNVVLTDGSNGSTIGTQTVAGLGVGASVTLTFNWNTATATVAGHILIAQQMLGDVNGSNNSKAIVVTVKAPVVPLTDIAVTGITAPATVMQGQSVYVGVNVGNIGNQSVTSSIAVTLRDSTDHVTLGIQTIPGGLQAGGSTTLTFAWNTTTAALGGHTLVAAQNLTDDNAANNQRTTAVTVNPPSTDLSVTSVTAPGSVFQGATASVGVTVQNVGGQNVTTAVTVILIDQTAGVTIGTQAISGLAVGAASTANFSWNTTGAALGPHTLVATQTLSDDNAANNQRSVAVTVSPKPTDLALAGITAPGTVSRGDTAHVLATVSNVGGLDVTASFNVVLTDATSGATIGTQTVAGLVVGASATLDFPWATGGVATGGHTLIARQMLADNNAGNDSRGIGINVTPPSIHVGNLTGVTSSQGNTWTTTVEIAVHDARHNLLDGVTVTGSWNGSTPASCTSGSGGGGSPGTCTVVLSSIPNSTRLVSFAVTGLTLSGYIYQQSANHDPDGSSNGNSIIVKR